MARLSGSEIARFDLVYSLMVAFMALAALALAVVPPGEAGAKEAAKLIVTLHWDATSDADIDLWVQSPGDGAVGFTRRTGAAFDLRHDHRGARVEGDHDNYEVADARHLPIGRYTVNAVAFNVWDKTFPVHVWATVERVEPTGGTTKLFRAEGELSKPEEEITLVNFRLDEAGVVVLGSDNKVLHCLYRRCAE
jgi:hypothetical protein